jgi:hypothetical protein
MPITVSGTQITFNDATVQTTAGGSGTVTSVATGNGLSGGTITTTGTLVVACPAHNTVGSYAFAGARDATNPGTGRTLTFGTNYAAGAGATNMQIATMIELPDGGGITVSFSNALSGTWKWMSKTQTYNLFVGPGIGAYGIACRVS